MGGSKSSLELRQNTNLQLILLCMCVVGLYRPNDRNGNARDSSSPTEVFGPGWYSWERVFEKKEGIYKYKGCTSIPPLSFIDDVLGITKCSVESVKLNALIQSKMDHKKLELNETKCFKMHVGPTSGSCPTLKVDGKEMKSVDRETYLGDILSSSWKINENIEERYNKGIGKINDIMSMLNEVSFGQYYFETALMFRESMLINSMLCNVEVLYGLTKAHIEKIRSSGQNLFEKNISITSIQTSWEFIHRIKCTAVTICGYGSYHTLLQKPDSELAKSVFLAQQKFTVKNDWVIQLKDDLEQCQKTLTEDEIKNMKKEKFKKFVKEKIRNLSNAYLLDLQQSHSKSGNILITENIKHYLISEELSLEQKRMLFLFRNQMCDVKTNYKTFYKSNMKCRLCDKYEESELHLLLCDQVINEDLKKEVCKVNASDVWKTFAKQKTAIILLNKIMKLRNMKYEKKKLSSGTQENSLFASSSYANIVLDWNKYISFKGRMLILILLRTWTKSYAYVKRSKCV